MSVPSDPKIDAFDVLQATFKEVDGHGIRVDILVPKNLTHQGKRPVITRFHGGGLVFGDSFFMDWWPQWLSDMAIEHGAVIVSPNYRLMPEAYINQISEDLEDFWTWLFSPALKDLLASHTTPAELDLDRIITAGESAGGTLSLQSALSRPSQIRASLASYPCVDPGSAEFANPKTVFPFGLHRPKSDVEEGLAAIKRGTPESSFVSQERAGFMLDVIEHGLLGGIYAPGSEDGTLAPIRALEKPKLSIPRGGISIIHGREDSVVSVKGSEDFVARAREVLKDGGDKVTLTVRDGDHGFDGGVLYRDQWLQDAFGAAVQTWLE